jgi:hypothetical protein
MSFTGLYNMNLLRLGIWVVVHFVRRFAEIIPTDTLMVRLPKLALGTQHFQINLWPKQFDLSHYRNLFDFALESPGNFSKKWFSMG